MIIKKDDRSVLRYEKDLPTLVIKPGHVMKARLRARYRQMYLHGNVQTEYRTIQLKTDDFMMPIYSIYVEESKGGLVVRQSEFLCGLSAHDPLEAWKVIVKHDTLPFYDIEGVLDDHGFPDIEAFNKKCVAGLCHYARYHNIISRKDFNTDRIELLEAFEIDAKKKK